MKNLKKEYKRNYYNIKKYYDYLSKYSINNTHVGLINEWILDNYYLLVKREKWINEVLNRNKYNKSTIFKLINIVLSNNNYKISYSNLFSSINKYQDENDVAFSYEELEYMPEFIYLSLIKKLNDVCSFEFISLKNIEKSNKFIKRLNDKFDIEKYFEDNKELLSNPNFISNLYNTLSELGNEYDKYLNDFMYILKINNIDLHKNLETSYINEADCTVLISNLFGSIIKLDSINKFIVFEETGKTEKLLLEDKYYSESDVETKCIYRNKIVSNSKKLHLTEYEYVKQFYNKNNSHIGFMLFKKPNYKARGIIYVSLIMFATTILSLLLSNYLFESIILSFFVLLIPVSEIVVQIINRVLLKITHARRIFKLDFESGIPKEEKTMVMITTILDNSKKVHEMYEKLEKYYVLNKSENLYFTLLGDAKSSTTKDTKYDEEVVNASLEEVKRLNKIYGDIFSFVYRNRFYNDKEECYLGYERKRGAIEQLNSLLLNKYSKDEKEKWFKCIKLASNVKDIKYVITLDVDTDLSLNNAIKLIGAMAHPLNTPILNKEKTKVIDGYTIIQPRVSVDIESSNKSIFTQIMAGLGGFDIYSNVTPEIYHDAFDTASYFGKGIYDLKVFDEVLNKKFKENRILSHDLLESCFVRCGYASDIELIDDYPSTFVIDAKRRHRWARGDAQIFSYIFDKELNIIQKWKIFDNIRRGLLNFSLLILLSLALIIPKVNFIYWFLFIILVIVLPIIFYMFDKLKIQKTRSTRLKQYTNIVFGLKSLLIRTYLNFSAIPYNAYLYVDAFIRSTYRMLISKKHLLEWTTAEESSKNDKGSLIDYFWDFRSNLFFVCLFLLYTIIYEKNAFFSVGVISIVFLSSPIFHYIIGKDINKKEISLGERKDESIRNLGLNTWEYFSSFLTKENHYLIPDNYQENRMIKCDLRTSPTNIGMSILSVISAYELRFIKEEETITYLRNIVNTIQKLEKYKGHLYNWYDIPSLTAISPMMISTVDSGNLIASLMVLSGFLLKHNELKLYKEINEIINAAKFDFLYHKNSGVFSIGYDVYASKLIESKYDIFTSEARITSYIAIAKGDIPYKNWFSMDKTLTKFYKYKGLLSWNGTSFEYFMPLIFLKTYDNSLVDEAYYFSLLCQKAYSKQINLNLPWGISESAYNELDDSRNYKYYAFGTPNLKIRENKSGRVVVSPYASILALEKDPTSVYENLVKFRKLNMYGKYGLYESYDYTDKTPVYSYFAHHQGMILSSIANYLKKDVIKEYLYDDARIRAFDILNKEKTQINPMIDNRLSKLTKVEYKKEKFKNSIRTYHELCERPEVSVLSNSKYSILINDRGNGFSRFSNIQLNRYRKISEQDYGTFLYIKDIDTNYVWSNTYSPTNVKGEVYEVTYALDKVKYFRKDKDITTSTEIIVTSKHNAEIRKITLGNTSDVDKELELTTYTEPIISLNNDDINHRVFNSMFIKSIYDKASDSLIFKKINRNNNDECFMLHRLIINKKTDYSYETLRNNFISRNDEYKKPTGLYKKLTNTTGDVIDPIGCMQSKIKLKANSKETVYIINGFGRSIEQINEIIKNYETKLQINDAFNCASIMTNREIIKLMVGEEDISNYNKALNYLYQTTRINITRERMELLRKNNLSQNNLWRYSVSGDLPIILFEIEDIKSIGLCKEVLKMFEYYKSIGIYIELVIINSSKTEYSNIIKREIDAITYKMYLVNDFNNTPGKIVIIEKEDINNDELNLFRSVSRIWINASNTKSLKDYIDTLQNNKSEYNYVQFEKLLSEKTKNNYELDYENKFGGFTNNGNEYAINTKSTPMPWVNILTNGSFGSIVSNNYNGFTFYKNSNEFKITSWGNETILDDKSEGISINNKDICFDKTLYGFGYAKYNFINEDYKIDMTTFIPKKDNVKLLILNIENLKNTKNEFNLSYWINPVLGNNEDKTARHIVSSFDKKSNALYLENRYSMYFKNHVTYLSSSEKIDNIIDTVLKKIINIKVILDKLESKKIVLMLGCDEDNTSLNNALTKYQNLENTIKEFKNTKDYWNKKLGVIKIDTPDNSFNYMINGWLSYQTIASRIYARAGFYQVSGAFGFRDQLQDACNIGLIDIDLLKSQIILCAKHEFIEGDVLHWWHNENNFGLRSRYKDDYLWLIYAVDKYLKITGDYSFLKEEIPFVVGDALKPNEEEKGIIFSYSDYTKSLYDHLRIIVNKAMTEISSNGLPFMGGGDWNDGMNKVGIKGTGSSVWLGFFMYDVINKFIKINEHLKINNKKETTFVNNLKKALKEKGYDKEYYLRAYFDDGTKLGSIKNDECKIDLISQAFAVITGIANKKQVELIDKNVDKYLVDKENKMIKLLTPAFKDMKPNPGYIMNYPKGIRENGGQYTHACAWYILALLKMKQFDKAFEYYQMLNPINHALSNKDALKYKVEPYVISADIYSNNNYIGQGGWTWYTGSAGWFYNVGIEGILGIKKEGNVLSIKPNVPKTWNIYKVIYTYKDTIYEITLVRGNSYKIIVDGVTRNEILLVSDKKTHIVEIEF